MRSSAIALLLLVASCAHTPVIAPAPFAFNQMDMHLHCGLERPVPLDDWLAIAANDGLKVILMLDHLELYRKTPAEYDAWLAEKKFPRWYSMGAEGHAAFIADLDTAIATRADLHLFKGWEIYEGELDTGIEEAPMRMADIIGWHISPNNGREAPNGQTLIKRAMQVRELQKRFPIPMILFHPFTMRIENLQRTAAAQNRDPKTITVEEYRFFQPGEQEALARILDGQPIFIEIGKTTGTMWLDPVVREAFIRDIKPLSEMGAQFTVSTDNHYMLHARTKFQPELYCPDLGLTPENTNGIVRELLR